MNNKALTPAWTLTAALAALALASCGSDPIPETPCIDANGVQVVCGFDQPEDIEASTDGSWLVISEMGGTLGAHAPGSISFFHPADERHYRAQIRMPTTFDPDENWGDTDCPAPKSNIISPHGIFLSERSDGRPQLTVISHYPRESIEIYTLANWGGEQYLVWKGCLIAPGMPYLNDVVVTADGSVYATHMFDSDSSELWLIPYLLMGWDTGFVWSWNAETGFRKVRGSEGSFPNGIAVDPEGATIFVNYYTNNITKAFDTDSHRLVASYEVPKPDNITYADDRLYIASHDVELGASSACEGRKSTCPLPFSIYRLDPNTMDGGQIYSGGGVPFGMATVAEPSGNRLWMGSFLGDRIASVRLPAQR